MVGKNSSMSGNLILSQEKLTFNEEEKFVENYHS